MIMTFSDPPIYKPLEFDHFLRDEFYIPGRVTWMDLHSPWFAGSVKHLIGTVKYRAVLYPPDLILFCWA